MASKTARAFGDTRAPLSLPDTRVADLYDVHPTDRGARMSWLASVLTVADQVEGALAEPSELSRLAELVADFALERHAVALLPASEEAMTLTAASSALSEGRLAAVPYGRRPPHGPVVIVETVHASGAGLERARTSAGVDVVGEIAVASAVQTSVRTLLTA